jgi:hypothetical protein
MALDMFKTLPLLVFPRYAWINAEKSKPTLSTWIRKSLTQINFSSAIYDPPRKSEPLLM